MQGVTYPDLVAYLENTPLSNAYYVTDRVHRAYFQLQETESSPFKAYICTALTPLLKRTVTKHYDSSVKCHFTYDPFTIIAICKIRKEKKKDDFCKIAKIFLIPMFQNPVNLDRYIKKKQHRALNF